MMNDHEPVCDTMMGSGSPCPRQGCEREWGRTVCKLHARVLRRRATQYSLGGTSPETTGQGRQPRLWHGKAGPPRAEEMQARVWNPCIREHRETPLGTPLLR